MKQKNLKGGLVAVCLGVGLSILPGCGSNFVKLEDFDPDKPLVVASDGLGSKDLRAFLSKVCHELNVPYVGEDNVCWFKNKEAIKKAHEQRRNVILFGYSAGGHQTALAAEWCEKEGIPVTVVNFDPTFLQGNTAPIIPPNVEEYYVYLSERNCPGDPFNVYGKGRAVGPEDLKSPQTRYYNQYLRGSHIEVFKKNSDVLTKEIPKIILNNRRQR